MAAHRLARMKKWPAYAFAAAVQEIPHDVHGDPVADLALKVAHMSLVFVAFTLID